MVREDKRRYVSRELNQVRLKFAIYNWKNRIPYDGKRTRGIWKKPRLHTCHFNQNKFTVLVTPFYTTRKDNES